MGFRHNWNGSQTRISTQHGSGNLLTSWNGFQTWSNFQFLHSSVCVMLS